MTVLRALPGLLLAFVAVFGLVGGDRAQAQAERDFDPAHVEAQARARAQAPYVAPDENMPAGVEGLGYDSWRRIAHARERSIPLGAAGFELQTYHRGWLFRSGVRLHLVRAGKARALAFSRDLFDYGEAPLSDPGPDFGFAGFRLLYPLNRRDKLDETISFLGASYFRFIGRGQAYGLSARGLAINAGSSDAREEFPAFREFWIKESDAPGAPAVIHALMDSPSIAGAYRFTLHAGARTFVEVDAVLYPRADLSGLGLAPLTSMFMTGPHDRRAPDAFRTNVHDSDTLLMRSAQDAWIARALRNPAQPRHSAFDGVRAFGLMQRERHFFAYEDLEAHYQLRPSYWVWPRGDWGEGSLRLVELPAPDETGDNIVAFWAPAQTPRALAPLRVSYVIETLDAGDALHDLARVRIAHLLAPRTEASARQRLLVDFAGGDLEYFSEDARNVRVEAEVHGARLLAARVRPHPPIKGLRAIIDVATDAAAGDVAARLIGPDGAILSETFLFPLTRLPADVTAQTPPR